MTSRNQSQDHGNLLRNQSIPLPWKDPTFRHVWVGAAVKVIIRICSPSDLQKVVTNDGKQKHEEKEQNEDIHDRCFDGIDQGILSMAGPNV